MVKYLFLLAGFASQGFAQTDNEKSHILTCRAQRDAVRVTSVLDESSTLPIANPATDRGQNPQLASQTLSTSEQQALVSYRKEPIALLNPTAEQRHLLNEPTFPGLKNRVFDSSANQTEKDEPDADQAQRYLAIYEHRFVDGLLRPQLEALTTNFFPEFSVSWDNYHIPYRWQGEFLLKGKDRWALLNRVVESFGIGVTVNGNFVMEFNAAEEQ